MYFGLKGKGSFPKSFLLILLAIGSVLPLNAGVVFDVAMSLLFWYGEGVVGWLVCSRVLFLVDFV